MVHIVYLFNPNLEPADKMRFAQRWANITSGEVNFKRATGVWLFTDSKTGKLAWLKINSNGMF